MRLIFLGPPGCGKGTQAKLLSEQRHLEHIATGDILRDAKRRGTPAGNRARSYIEAGKLVPDDLVNDLIAERFSGEDRPQRFIMDGYPRTLNQAEAFERVLRQHGLNLTRVVLFKVDEEELVRRVAGRLSCPKTSCKATYHIISRPPQRPGICDLCGTPLVQREDDKEETIRERLAVYHRQTAELIDYYRKQGLLREVFGEGEIPKVYERLLAVLDEEAG
ncbi:MAG: adenylate kinase [Planctomycetes bacterium]|nr:adenylate kinase [Planctomycetota bacterium]